MRKLILAPTLLAPVLALLAFAPATAAPAAQKKGKNAAPPGMVLVKGGRTKLGYDFKTIEKMINDKPTAKGFIRTLDGTTPQVDETVAGFFMGVTEVTNEQYMEFVKATGARPPHYWAAEAVDGARKEFLSNRDRDRTISFDPAGWWIQNWRDHEWSEPEGVNLLRPVTFVTLRDAQSYAAWIGLRLPTDAEFQRACRGNGTAAYPWGDEWEDGKFAATNEIRAANGVFPVGSFPAGNSSEGVMDLAGNVWEWTVSPYAPYKGWKPGNEYLLGKNKKTGEVLQPLSNWDPSLRVTKGGAYVNGNIAAMCTTRRATAPNQQTDAVGFRVVASMVPGSDLAGAVFQNTLSNSQARGTDVVFDEQNAALLDFWETRPTACTPEIIKKDRKARSYVMPEDLTVVTGYEHMLFVPRTELAQTSDVQFERETLKEVQQLGFLSLTEPMIEPTLAEGVYLIGYRAKGKSIVDKDAGKDEDPEGDPAAASEDDSVLYGGQIDLKKNNLVILDAKSGELMAHVELEEGLSIGKGAKGKIEFRELEKKIWVKNEVEGEDDVQVIERWVELYADIPTRQGKRYLPMTLEMKPAESFFEKKWRW